ncbi:MAG: right-handed parallel beta-helix repeat-containing protein, partial [Crocinitomicaceae bacterium]|nr:right-handed parallel beta-helix repeat-containing protein [Crocinitomicaceae bacterium]
MEKNIWVTSDPYFDPGNSKSERHGAIRTYYSDYFPCAKRDMIYSFSSELNVAGVAEGIICVDSFEPVATSNHHGAPSPIGNSRTVAHEIGHNITAFHTEFFHDPTHGGCLSLCNSNNYPLMCSSGGTSFSFSEPNQCRMYDHLLAYPECFVELEDQPECPNCEIRVNIKADKSYVNPVCSGPENITYTMTVWNDCDPKYIVVGLRNIPEQQEIVEFGMFGINSFSDPAYPDFEIFKTDPQFFEEGQAKTFTFTVEVKPGPMSSYRTYGLVEFQNVVLEHDFVIINSGVNDPTFSDNGSLLPLSSLTGNELPIPSFACSGLGPYVNFNLDGTLIIDEDYCFLNRNITLLPGSRIYVAQGHSLIIENSVISNCDNLPWNDITVENGGTLHTINSTIEGGLNAINITGNSTVSIENSTFRNNATAVRIATPNTNFTDLGGNIIEDGETGVELDGVTGLIAIGNSSGEANVFRSLENGIFSTNSNLAVLNTVFFNITGNVSAANPGVGCAIYTDASHSNFRVMEVGQNTEFHNCSMGVLSKKMNTYIHHTTMYNTERGFNVQQAWNKEISIYDNELINVADWGIALVLNQPFNCDVESNSINVNNPSNPNGVGILLAESVYSSNNHNNYRVRGNEITLGAAAKGIQMYSGQFIQLYDNDITMSLIPGQKGIEVGGSRFAMLRCNNVELNETTTQEIGTIAIDVTAASSSILSCNDTRGTRVGISFDGMSDNTTFRGNNIYEHQIGLQINANGQIGTQNQQGNRWYGPFESVGAWHLATNSAALQQSTFIVDADESTPFNYDFLPTISAVDQWFLDFDVANPYADIFYCSSPLLSECLTADYPNDPRFYLTDGLDDKLMDNTFVSTNFENELAWTGKRHLSARMNNENANPTSNGINLINFLNNSSNTSFGNFNNIENNLREELGLTTTELSNLAFGIETILSNVAIIQQIDQQIDQQISQTTDESLKSSLLNDRIDFIETILYTAQGADYLSSNKMNTLENSLISLKSNNQLVSASLLPEVSEKYQND